MVKVSYNIEMSHVTCMAELRKSCGVLDRRGSGGPPVAATCLSSPSRLLSNTLTPLWPRLHTWLNTRTTCNTPAHSLHMYISDIYCLHTYCLNTAYHISDCSLSKCLILCQSISFVGTFCLPGHDAEWRRARKKSRSSWRWPWDWWLNSVSAVKV